MVSKAVALTLFGLSVVGTGHTQMVGEVGLPIGSRPNPVVLEDLEGNDADLGRYFGSGPVLLEFWATWCENCEALAPQMERAYEEYGDRIEFLAIGVGVNQSPRSIKRHLRRHPSDYPYFFDSRGRAVREFQAPATSFIVVLDSSGVVTYTGIGPDQNIEEAVLTALSVD